MTKYIITTGKCVITSVTSEKFESYVNHSPLMFDKIGEAMLWASRINDLLNHSCFKVESIEINTSVSSNL